MTLFSVTGHTRQRPPRESAEAAAETGSVFDPSAIRVRGGGDAYLDTGPGLTMRSVTTGSVIMAWRFAAV